MNVFMTDVSALLNQFFCRTILTVKVKNIDSINSNSSTHQPIADSDQPSE